MAGEPIEGQWINTTKELLEKELKDLHKLKDSILKWEKNKEEREKKLEEINQEIFAKEKEILQLKLEELNKLREQITQSKEIHQEKEKSQIDFNEKFKLLEDRINNEIESLNTINQKEFEKINKLLDENLENLKKEVNEEIKKTIWNLSFLSMEIYEKEFDKILPDHNGNIGRSEALLTMKHNIEISAYNKNENIVARIAAEKLIEYGLLW